mmetsp:Transcript_16846/g.23567  ORF Transcript_16846/g.23567 Transcript_16846/m.23567 type:complete len:211 (+) Transcript_16846:67-699(+)
MEIEQTKEDVDLLCLRETLMDNEAVYANKIQEVAVAEGSFLKCVLQCSDANRELEITLKKLQLAEKKFSCAKNLVIKAGDHLRKASNMIHHILGCASNKIKQDRYQSTENELKIAESSFARAKLRFKSSKSEHAVWNHRHNIRVNKMKETEFQLYEAQRYLSQVRIDAAQAKSNIEICQTSLGRMKTTAGGLQKQRKQRKRGRCDDDSKM